MCKRSQHASGLGSQFLSIPAASNMETLLNEMHQPIFSISVTFTGVS